MELQLDLPAEKINRGALPEAKLVLHHVAVLVRSLDDAIPVYRQLGGGISEPVTISSQGVRICFVDVKGSVAIELVEGAGDGVTAGLLKKGMTYYHLGYMVEDFDASVESLEASNYVLMQTFRSEAFDGRRCAFLMSPVRHLIEIIEQG